MVLANYSKCWKRCHQTCAMALAVIAITIVPQACFAGIMPGTLGTLAFDFVNGGPTALNNTISVENINVSGPSGSGIVADFTQLDDSVFPDFEIAISITYGTDISFRFKPLTSILEGSSPDSFTFFLLDQAGTASLFSTTAPGATDALFALDIDGSTSGALTVYGDADPVTSWTVSSPDANGYYNVHIHAGDAPPPGGAEIPEPASLLLWSVLVTGLVGYSRKRLATAVRA